MILKVTEINRQKFYCNWHWALNVSPYSLFLACFLRSFDDFVLILSICISSCLCKFIYFFACVLPFVLFWCGRSDYKSTNLIEMSLINMIGLIPLHHLKRGKKREKNSFLEQKPSHTWIFTDDFMKIPLQSSREFWHSRTKALCNNSNNNNNNNSCLFVWSDHREKEKL